MPSESAPVFLQKPTGSMRPWEHVGGLAVCGLSTSDGIETSGGMGARSVICTSSMRPLRQLSATLFRASAPKACTKAARMASRVTRWPICCTKNSRTDELFTCSRSAMDIVK